VYSAWAAQHSRAPAAPAVAARRRAAFHQNRAAIQAWNAGGHAHNQTLNRFADWTQARPDAAQGADPLLAGVVGHVVCVLRLLLQRESDSGLRR